MSKNNPLKLVDFGVEKADNFKFPFAAPICCGNKMTLCMYFDTIAEFVHGICLEYEKCVCIALMQDESYVCGVESDKKIYKVGGDDLKYSCIIPYVMQNFPNTVNLCIIQHINTDEKGACEFTVIEE